MKTARIVREAGDGLATWTITAGYDDSPDKVWTVAAAQSLDATVSFDTLQIERDAMDVSPSIETNVCTIYLRDTLQYFPQVTEFSPEVFTLWALFWCWLASRIVS